MSDPIYQVPLDRVANEPISMGIHEMVISDVSEGEGDKGAYWSFTVASTTPGEEGKTARLFLSLSPQSRWRMEIFLDAVGAPKKGMITADKFIGKRFRAKITHEDYEGRPQARINDMMPVGSTSTASSSSVPATPPVVKRVAASAPEQPEPNLPLDDSDDEPPF